MKKIFLALVIVGASACGTGNKDSSATKADQIPSSSKSIAEREIEVRVSPILCGLDHRDRFDTHSDSVIRERFETVNKSMKEQIDSELIATGKNKFKATYDVDSLDSYLKAIKAHSETSLYPLMNVVLIKGLENAQVASTCSDYSFKSDSPVRYHGFETYVVQNISCANDGQYDYIKLKNSKLNTNKYFVCFHYSFSVPK